jgi:hypothetical protein
MGTDLFLGELVFGVLGSGCRHLLGVAVRDVEQNTRTGTADVRAGIIHQLPIDTFSLITLSPLILTPITLSHLSPITLSLQ